MKKLITWCLILVLMFTSLTSCKFSHSNPNNLYNDISKFAGVEKEEYENYTIFKFDKFNGKSTSKIGRVGLEEGTIYFYANLTEGSVDIKYDRGALYSEEPLVTLNASENMPIESSGGYVEGDEVYIIFNSTFPVSGEIVISFIPLQ